MSTQEHGDQVLPERMRASMVRHHSSFGAGLMALGLGAVGIGCGIAGNILGALMAITCLSLLAELDKAYRGWRDANDTAEKSQELVKQMLAIRSKVAP